MANRLSENRRRFLEIVYGLKDFKESEVVETFRQDRNGEIEIDGGQNLLDALKELREIGVLRYEYGRYHLTGRRDSAVELRH